MGKDNILDLQARLARQIARREAAETSEAGGELPTFAHERDCWEHFELVMGTGGRPWPNLDNIWRILAKHPQFKEQLWFDEFRSCVMHDHKNWEDKKNSSVTIDLQRDCYMSALQTSTVAEAVETYAHAHSRHPIKEFLDALPAWDATERCAHFFSRGCGAEDNELTSSIGLSFFLSLIGRIYEPGCHVRTMAVLEGFQEQGKSSVLQVLAAPWVLECSSRLDSKDFYQDIQGYWIIELPELSSMMRADVEAVKNCISKRDDVYRASYGRRVHSHPRQCIFVGTTNRSDWQLDDTGGTRYLPVACTQMDLAWVGENRAQLLAEALARYRRGEKWYAVPKDLVAEQQERRFVEDPWTELVARFLVDRKEISMTELFDFALEIKVKDRGQREANRLSKVLQRMGWRVFVKKDEQRRSSRVYRRD